MDSPPPRFAEGSPRFTENFGVSPPYHHYAEHGIDNQPSPQYTSYAESEALQHRLSNKERAYTPDLSSPLPESVLAAEGDKEVAYPAVQPLPYQRPSADETNARNRRHICGLALKTFYVLLILILALAIGLGVGLGVGLGTKHSRSATTSPTSNATATSASPSSTPTSTSDQYSIGGVISPAYYTTDGAFNGSGIALASQSFAANLQDAPLGSLVMYFQHHSGDIRWERLTSTGSWVGGSESEIVASDAKNSTPISAVAYVLNGTSTWHIFYIDVNNHLRQRSSSNTTGLWIDGPLNSMNATVLDADQVGMQACWYGSDYGDSDYTHTSVPSTGSTAASHEVGMHMWYASDATTFQQLGWRAGDEEWSFQQSWLNLNGHAGVGCFSWGEGTVTYVMFVDTENTVNFYWKDTNANSTGNSTHPINQWTNSSISIPNVDPATSLGYTNYFYAQDGATGMINGYNISWAAENTSFVPDDYFTVAGEPALPGSHLSVSAIPNLSGGDSLLVFYQTNGSDITEYTRDLAGGQWAQVSIEIPDT